MKVTIETLQDTFKYGYEQYEPSRLEAKETWDMYHNRQYTEGQENVLSNRGQPKETFNVIKLFARMLMGYYSTVVNTVAVLPVQVQDTDTALLLNDIVQQLFDPTKFSSESDKIKLGGLISGLMVVYEQVVDTGEKDEFGRPIREVIFSYVPDDEIVLDPSHTLDNYSDADWIHRHKWFHEDTVRKNFGQEKLDELIAYHNHLEQNDTEFESDYNGEFVGKFKVYDNYLIVHTVMIDDDDRTWSTLWSGDVILQKTELKDPATRFPYRIHKLHSSNLVEYYGIFREVIETQKAINQALIKFQLLANTQKVLVQKGAVEDLDLFTSAFNRVSGVIEVAELAGIKFENLAREALEQYIIIDKGFNRVQRVLNINDSFLGLAFASDSGRKVKLQQNASITALRYLTGQIEQFYRWMGEDVVNNVKKYYTASQAIRIVDEAVGMRWIQINQPLKIWTGEYDPQGNPIMETQYEEVLDPNTGEPLVTDEGQRVIAPIPEKGTEIAFSNVDITISSVAFDDVDEKNQVMLEDMLSGNIGNLLSQANPSGFFRAAALSVRSLQTKHSPEVSRILTETADLLGGNQQAEQQVANDAAANPDLSSQRPNAASQAQG